MAPPHGVPC